MIIETEVAEYDPAKGVRPPAVFGAQIELSIDGSEVVIRANDNGLRLLAGAMLALAQDGTPAGSHLHFDPGVTLEDGSTALVVTRVDPGF